jgi:nucleoside-diphosphate-sugar epimerase
MVLDISKIKTELGYKEQTNIDNSLDSIANWVQKIGGVEVLKMANKELAWS